jgi:acyl phosphate:glycerol-3-phosphate acyltransferase
VTGYVAAALLGYVLGSIPCATLVARRHGVDLHRTGDGNPGAWNALEQLGPARAWPAFAGDGAKALLAGLGGLALAGWWGVYAAVAGAMVGHALPLFAGFRGGKAVMCFVGGGFVLAPEAALTALLLCLTVTVATRSFAWGARAGVFAFPVLQLVIDGVERVAATGALMTLIGLLFLLRRRPARASGAAAARPTAPIAPR